MSFDNVYCAIQDYTSRTLIRAEQYNVLFYFKEVEPVKINNVSGDDSTTLWHQRLRHPSTLFLLPLRIIYHVIHVFMLNKYVRLLP